MAKKKERKESTPRSRVRCTHAVLQVDHARGDRLVVVKQGLRSFEECEREVLDNGSEGEIYAMGTIHPRRFMVEAETKRRLREATLPLVARPALAREPEEARSRESVIDEILGLVGRTMSERVARGALGYEPADLEALDLEELMHALTGARTAVGKEPRGV